MPLPAALEFVSGSRAIFPKAYFKKVGQRAFGKQPVGTGPFKLAAERACFMPMHTIVVGYAPDKRLAYQPSPDGCRAFSS